MQSAAKPAGKKSARELGEALRREWVGSLIGGGGEAWERPGQVAPFVDALELAGAEDRIENRRAPAGVRMADEEEIFFPTALGLMVRFIPRLVNDDLNPDSTTI